MHVAQGPAQPEIKKTLAMAATPRYAVIAAGAEG